MSGAGLGAVRGSGEGGRRELPIERQLREILKLPSPAAEEIAIESRRAAGDLVPVDRLLERANELMGGMGVEAINLEGTWQGHYYRDIALLYVNMGDTYQPTLLYDTNLEKFSVGAWGDWLEEHEQRAELGISIPEPPAPAPALGYDMNLPSMPPFMYIEDHKALGDLGVISYGAYNALGLIGTEKGGVAVVIEEPFKGVLATKDIPWDPAARAGEFETVVGIIDGVLKGARRGREEVRIFPAESRDELVEYLRGAGYDVR